MGSTSLQRKIRKLRKIQDIENWEMVVQYSNSKKQLAKQRRKDNSARKIVRQLEILARRSNENNSASI